MEMIRNVKAKDRLVNLHIVVAMIIARRDKGVVQDNV